MQIRFFILILIILSMGLYNPGLSNASKAEELKNKIENRSTSIGELEKEIAEYQVQIEKVGAEKKTLSNEVYRLNLDKKKLSSDITLTNNKIHNTNLNIDELALGIEDKEERIKNNTIALSETMRLINESDSNSLVEVLLSTDDISDFWGDIEDLQRFQIGVRERTAELQNLRTDLQENKEDSEEKERELLGYRSNLSDKKQIVEYNKKEKDQLLSATKNKESNYQKILEEKLVLRQKLETELREFEAQLEYTLNKGSLPKKGSGVLISPLKNPRVTQEFGLTPFARTGAYGYDKSGNPNPHRGVDFGASIGTPLLATAGGVVRYSEDMDSYPGCVSYGKWVLIDHDNGLSSFYAHLSLIKVTKGQVVNTGDIIGYSGNSGYSTAPHLHFSVFDKSAVKVSLYTWSRGCKEAQVAYAPLDAYLDPTDYLVSLSR